MTDYSKLVERLSGNERNMCPYCDEYGVPPEMIEAAAAIVELSQAPAHTAALSDEQIGELVNKWLGECTCLPDFMARDRRDPQCNRCNNEYEFKQAIREALEAQSTLRK